MNNQVNSAKQEERFSAKECVNRQFVKESKKTSNIRNFHDNEAFQIFMDVINYVSTNDIKNVYLYRYLYAIKNIGQNEQNIINEYSNWQNYCRETFGLLHSSFVDTFVGLRSLAKQYEIIPLDLPSINNLTWQEWCNILKKAFQHNINSHNCKPNQHMELMMTSFGDNIYKAINIGSIPEKLFKSFNKRQTIFKTGNRIAKPLSRRNEPAKKFNTTNTIDFTTKEHQYIDNYANNVDTRKNDTYLPSFSEEDFNKIPEKTFINLEKEIEKKYATTNFATNELNNVIKNILNNYYILNKRIFSNTELIPGDIFSPSGISLNGYTFIMFPNNTDSSGELVVLGNNSANSFNYIINKANKIII